MRVLISTRLRKKLELTVTLIIDLIPRLPHLWSVIAKMCPVQARVAVLQVVTVTALVEVKMLVALKTLVILLSHHLVLQIIKPVETRAANTPMNTKTTIRIQKLAKTTIVPITKTTIIWTRIILLVNNSLAMHMQWAPLEVHCSNKRGALPLRKLTRRRVILLMRLLLKMLLLLVTKVIN